MRAPGPDDPLFVESNDRNGLAMRLLRSGATEPNLDPSEDPPKGHAIQDSAGGGKFGYPPRDDNQGVGHSFQENLSCWWRRLSECAPWCWASP